MRVLSSCIGEQSCVRGTCSPDGLDLWWIIWNDLKSWGWPFVNGWKSLQQILWCSSGRELYKYASITTSCREWQGLGVEKKADFHSTVEVIYRYCVGKKTYTFSYWQSTNKMWLYSISTGCQQLRLQLFVCAVLLPCFNPATGATCKSPEGIFCPLLLVPHMFWSISWRQGGDVCVFTDVCFPGACSMHPGVQLIAWFGVSDSVVFFHLI